MFARLIRFGAALALPLTVVGAAAAQYEGNEQPAGLMLFSGEDFRGEVREVFDSVYSLNDYYFNDRAQSVAVLSGAWELCEHSDFTGRCVLIRGDVQDLDWYGLDRELTSVRPIYEYTEAEHGLMFTRDQSGYIRVRQLLTRLWHQHECQRLPLWLFAELSIPRLLQSASRPRPLWLRLDASWRESALWASLPQATAPAERALWRAQWRGDALHGVL